MTQPVDIFADAFADTFGSDDFSEATNLLYSRLPAYIRRADLKSGTPLLRWVSALTDQLGEVFTIAERIDFIPRSAGGAAGDTSDLTDPATADPSWLPWLAQLVGVRLDPTLDIVAQRDAVKFASSGWQAGTKAAIAGAAKSVLNGSRYVKVYDHSTEAGVGEGGEWDVLIITAANETPDPTTVLDAVLAKNAKPAGVVLHYVSFSSTWAQIQTAYPTWRERNGSWARLEEVGLP